MRLLKRYFFEVVTSLFGLTASPLSQFVTILLDHPPPRPVTYFLNGPLEEEKGEGTADDIYCIESVKKGDQDQDGNAFEDEKSENDM